MLNNNNYRIEQLDILKALGIICVVAGHAEAPFTKFIYLFHVAIFFIASGFFYKKENSQNIQSVIKAFIRKVKQLYIPIFIWNIIFTLLHNFFIRINVYTDNANLLNYVTGHFIHTIEYYSASDTIIKIIKSTILIISYEQIFGTVWFLKALFMISVCYLFFDYIIKHLLKKQVLLIQFIIAIILLIFGFYCFKVFNSTFYGIAQTCSFYCLYFIGHILQIHKEKFSAWNWKQYLPILLISFGSLLWLNGLGNIELTINSYENPFFLLSTSLFGWLLLYSLSYFIQKYLYLKKTMIVIGKYTLSILILHFLSFKLVATIVVYYYDIPSFCIAAFPNLFGSIKLWWLVYTIIGVFIPVILGIVYHNFINGFHSCIVLKNKTRTK